MELVLAGVLGGQLVGRASKELGELRHVADVALDGVGSQVTQLHVFDEALSQGSHGGHRRSGRNRNRTRSVSILTGGPESAQERIIVTTGTGGSRACAAQSHGAEQIAHPPADGSATRGRKTSYVA